MFLCGKQGSVEKQPQWEESAMEGSVEEANEAVAGTFDKEIADAAKRPKGCSVVTLVFGTRPVRPNGGEWKYTPQYRKGNSQRVIFGLNGEASSLCNLFSGFERVVTGWSVEKTAKKFATECFEELFVSGALDLESVEHRATVYTSYSSGASCTRYVYYCTLSHLEDRGDLWFMREGFRKTDGVWRKWICDELTDDIVALLGGVRVLGTYDYEDIPYGRMMAGDRTWLAPFLEGNCFVTANVTCQGEQCTSSSMSMSFKKPGTFRSIYSLVQPGGRGRAQQTFSA